MIVWVICWGLKATGQDIRSGDSTWIYSGGRGDVLAAVVWSSVFFGRRWREGEVRSINVDSHPAGR